MCAIHLVQPRTPSSRGRALFFAFAFIAAFGWKSPATAEPAPDAVEILKTVRVAQSSQTRALTGQLRNGPNKIPFRLTMKDGEVRWEFSEPAQTIVLRLGDNDSSLEEITADGKKKVGAAKFDDAVRGSDITYEDLSLRFIYWSKAEVEGEQTIMLTKSWQVLVQPPSPAASTYSKVRLWIAKETGALMKAEAFGRDGKLARTFRVVSGQKLDGLWILKSMRIESNAARTGGDRTPTYLEIDKVES